MGSANQQDRRDFDIPSSHSAQYNFMQAASHLEHLIDQRNTDVLNAMSDYQADGVSEEYRLKEKRWHDVADEVKAIIDTLRMSLSGNDEAAALALQQAKANVAAI